jgi:hypothetical protein
MMQLASLRSATESAAASGGLLPRMRAWFARNAAVWAPAHDERHDAGSRDVVLHEAGSSGVVPAAPLTERAKTATVLAFPIHGEALLVRLADQLRNRVANQAVKSDPFLLTVSRRGSCSCLTIDRSASVEFDAGSAGYRVVIEATPETTITAATTDFDTAVKFVAQYVGDRLADAANAETES